MEVLSFDIEGKFAHFRKYYANNTAFTFSLPPRTTIMGIIAGAMGLEKDSYYEDFGSDNLKIGINILSLIKKSFHRLNFLMIKGDSDFRGRQKHIQTPFEVISGINLQTDMVKYRIYIAPTGKGVAVFEKVKPIFMNKKFHYNPTLGTANFLAQITNIKTYSDVEINQINNEEVSLNSARIIRQQQRKRAITVRCKLIFKSLPVFVITIDINALLKRINIQRVLISIEQISVTIKKGSDGRGNHRLRLFLSLQ